MSDPRRRASPCGCERDSVTQKLLAACEWHAHAARLRQVVTDGNPRVLLQADRVAIAAVLARVDMLERQLERVRRAIREDTDTAEVVPFDRSAGPPDPDGNWTA